MVRRIACLSVSLLGLLGSEACVRDRDVRLELARGPGGAPAGFFCRAPTAGGGGPYLLERLASELEPCEQRCPAGTCRRAAFVFDFVETAGIPSCRGGSIAAFCAEARCEVTVRRCFDTEVCVGSDLDATVAAATEAIRLASSGVLLEDAPAAPVLVRMVGAAQTCSDVASEGLARDRVFGCAYSCPAQLDAVEGSVLLDLDSLDDECGTAVYGCALFLSGEDPAP